MKNKRLVAWVVGLSLMMSVIGLVEPFGGPDDDEPLGENPYQLAE